MFFGNKNVPQNVVCFYLQMIIFESMFHENSLKTEVVTFKCHTWTYIFGASTGPLRNKVQIPIKTGIFTIWVGARLGLTCRDEVEHAFLQNNTLSLEWAWVAPAWLV